jgi:uroporphyrinogen III methyltransferase/synthase
VTVSLVGAGPGDPGLLTRRGAALLAAADIVVHDRLANAELLELAPPGALRVDVGKAPGRAAMSQDEINALLVEHGRAGRAVVRLKGGDPFVFGRGGEEAAALLAAGVPFEVVPGVSSAIAAPAYAGIPVTQRGVSTHVTIVTGHEDPAKGAVDTDWETLARAGGTIVVLMGAGNLDGIVARLVAGGLAPETPVAAVRWGTRPEQETVRTTLAGAPGAGIAAPSAIVVGDVAALDLAWFDRRPLFGRRIVVTRARGQASELRRRLEALGARVIELPAIAIEPLPVTLPDLAEVGWLVFTSPNGVAAFFGALDARGLDARALQRAKVAAIGPGTAGALAARGIRADLVPDRFVAEALVDAFPAPVCSGERVVIARAEEARDVLPDGLCSRGYAVEVLPVYRTVMGRPDEAALAALRDGHVDAVTFTSSSTVRNFCALAGALGEPRPAVVSIGPVTSATAREHGLTVDVEADRHDLDGLVAAVLARLGHRGDDPVP